MAGTALEKGQEILRKLFAGATPRTALPADFARMTVEHVFGNVWSRPGLTLEEREMITTSVLVALGTFLSQNERRFITYRVLVFILIAIGVGALWGLSAMGGFGGSSGRSMWLGLLILPYLIGWSMGIWGPGSPRWLLLLGIAVGLWYEAIFAMVLWNRRGRAGAIEAALVVSALGVLTIVGCISRLRNRTAERQ